MSKLRWLPYADSEHSGLGVLLTVDLILIVTCVPVMVVCGVLQSI